MNTYTYTLSIIEHNEKIPSFLFNLPHYNKAAISYDIVTKVDMTEYTWDI